MIQRKQTLFMLITAILCALTLIMPLATIELAAPAEASIVGQSDGASYTVWGIEYFNGQSEMFIYHGILNLLCLLLPLISIFMFKKRTFQLRMTIVEGILLLGLIGFEAIGIYRLNEMFVGTPYLVNHSLIVVAPLFALGSTFLAYKGILHDILLLRSSDRIR